VTSAPPYRITTTEWVVKYPAQAEPIGVIRLERIEGVRRYVARDGSGELLGDYPDGDAAVEAVWGTFLAANRAQHEHASRTHGGAGRHPNDESRPRSPGVG
jgi:hypothetical protein